VKADNWLANYPHTLDNQHIAIPTQGRDSGERMDAYAQQQGFQSYNDLQKAQKMRDNPNWEKAGEFANKLGDAAMGAEGVGSLGKGAIKKLAEMHWGKAAESLGDAAPKRFTSYGVQEPINTPYRGPITAPKGTKDMLDMKLTEGVDPRTLSKEDKIWNNIKSKKKLGGKIASTWLEKYS